MTILFHKELGKIEGECHNGVVQYRGIKYASLKHRFGPPELHTRCEKPAVVDATKVGPAAIGNPTGCELELELIQQHLIVPHLPPQSDTECLNLTVTAPGNPGSTQLPVFVFIHGGGLAMGSGTWPQYDHSAIVRRSIEIGRPIIGVNINYRTGIFGFLTSEELRSAGFKANNGLRDQKAAFQWVRKFISGFNGDPENITAIGQSAGGVSATLLLQSEEPLFDRMVVMSGTCLALRPEPTTLHEKFYEQVCEIHGLTNLSGDQRLEALDKINSHELLAKIPPSVPSLPAIDNEFIHDVTTYETVKDWQNRSDPALPGLRWCRELLIGDCQFDGSIYQLALGFRKADIGKQLEQSLNVNVPEHEVEIDKLVGAYGISAADNDEIAYLRVLEFINDVLFYVPTVTVSNVWPGTVYVYHLNEPNPWEGPFKGQATHILDVALLFKNFDHTLDEGTRAVGEAFGDATICFINATSPWKASSAHEPIAFIFGGEAKPGKLVEDIPAHTGRRETLIQYDSSIGFDTLRAAAVAFLSGR
ncbi:hypothetical protein LTR05_002499 [Lithohypha guttulata]|uniref:Carboxylesterase type B domain-containing protein n=1 Tax=Lithohypha guttulata TaxID=1690604 RepID=A0AAN7T2A5_9EURO|nr:hypothetical protein LTR05_002499 [Lithohypha guttulata]